MRMENLFEFPFDMYQRYKDIQVIVKNLFGTKKVSVLDVGGENNLIRKFLPDAETYPINLVNEKASNFIRGSGVCLPFKDSVFDIVVTADTMEHIKPKDRDQFIAELIRTSKDHVIIIAPFDNGVQSLADKFLFEVILQLLGLEHPALKEHITNGLPKLQEVTIPLEKLKAKYSTFSSGNIHNWLTMMVIKHYFQSIPDSEQLHKYVDSFYNHIFYEFDHSSPSYRKVFVISKKGLNLEFIKNEFEITNSEITEANLLKFFDTISVLSNISMVQQLHEKEKRIQGVENILGEKERLILQQSAHIQNLEHVLEDKEQHIADVENVLSEKEKLIKEQMDHAQNLEKVLEDKERHIVDVENVLAEKENLIIQQSDHIQNLEKVLGEKEKHIANVENVLAEKGNLILEQSDQTKNLEKVLEGKEKHIADLKAVLEEKERLIKEQSDYARDLENVLENKEKHLTDIESVLKEKESLIIKQADYSKNLENVLGRKEKKIADLENALNQLYKSKVFRIYNKVAKIKK
jgi:ABC-type transporter Mla subunit MlaD/SAM-dependent methyltransferase